MTGPSFQRPSPAMVVALIALFVALGGTGYAVTRLPANSVGAKQLKKKAVTTKKIRNKAVTSAKVKNFSLLANDFKSGQLPAGAQGEKGDQGPPGPTFAATTMGSSFEPPTDPPATPDETSANTIEGGRHFDFTLPAGGQVYVRFFIAYWGLSCTSGPGRSGLYLDGAPVPKTSRPLAPSPSQTAVESVALISAGAGAHSLEARMDCPSGNSSSSNIHGMPTWTVLLLEG